jgi:hypothetical protein
MIVSWHHAAETGQGENIASWLQSRRKWGGGRNLTRPSQCVKRLSLSSKPYFKQVVWLAARMVATHRHCWKLKCNWQYTHYSFRWKFSPFSFATERFN